MATGNLRLVVAFFAKRADLALCSPLVGQDWGAEALAVGSRAAYMWCAEGILASRLAEAVGRTLGDRVTTRNWATVNKLHGLAAPGS